MKGLIITREESDALRSLAQNQIISLLPVANRSILEYQVDLFARCGIKDIFIIVTRGVEEDIENRLTMRQDINYQVIQGKKLEANKELNQVFTANPVVALLGPLLTDIDLVRVIGFHRGRGSSATLILRSVWQQPHRNLVITDNQGRVTGVLPQVVAGGQIACTIGSLYILEPPFSRSAIDMLLAGKEEDICPHLLATGFPVYGFFSEEYWLQVKDPATYLQANRDFLFGLLRIKPSGKQVAPGIWLGKDTKIAGNVKLESPVIIGDGVELKEGVRVGESVLGAETCIDKGSVVIGSVLQERCYVGKEVRAKGIILGECTIVANGAVLDPGVFLSPHSVISRGSLLGGPDLSL